MFLKKKKSITFATMNKCAIVLVLLLLSVFSYSCSSNKNSTVIKSKKVVIPEQSRYNPDELGKDKKKNEKEVDPKQQHYNRQTEAVRKAMKKNAKISMKNTPVRAKKRSCSSFRKGSCGNRYDNNMFDEGIRDVR